MKKMGEGEDAERLLRASTHWLRHTFAKSALASGVEMRDVAAALGHASMDTTMLYTQQEVQDLIEAWERAQPGSVAQEIVV